MYSLPCMLSSFSLLTSQLRRSTPVFIGPGFHITRREAPLCAGWVGIMGKWANTFCEVLPGGGGGYLGVE